ncbi:MAG: glycosyltransferase [Candidatus Omnitrophica bacterium]|nr:glycosyltransferase [Candidatus Omnitrophota bacterium]
MKYLNGTRISIIMPAYNEADRIVSSLEETMRTFDNFKLNYEIIIVDDGSADATYKIVHEFARKVNNDRIIVQRNRSNYGKGRALRKGFRFAKGEYVIFLDADMDLHPGQIDTFFDIMRLTESDIVIGSKRHPNSQLTYPPERRLMSSVYFFLVKMLFGLPINDTQTGLKLFKHHVLKQVFREYISREFAFDLELLVNAHRLGYKIAEAPVCIQSQREYSRIGIGTVYKMCLDTFAIYFRFVRNRMRHAASTVGGKKHVKNNMHYHYKIKNNVT